MPLFLVSKGLASQRQYLPVPGTPRVTYGDFSRLPSKALHRSLARLTSYRAVALSAFCPFCIRTSNSHRNSLNVCAPACCPSFDGRAGHRQSDLG